MVCSNQLAQLEENKEELKMDKVKEDNPTYVLYHIINCTSPEVYENMNKFSEAARVVQGRECPGCKTVTRKSDGCNHMTCEKCKVHWCYCCGLSNQDADHRDNDQSMYGHFVDWKTNANRCP